MRDSGRRLDEVGLHGSFYPHTVWLALPENHYLRVSESEQDGDLIFFTYVGTVVHSFKKSGEN
jgi:hypothetical protein